MKIQSYLKEYEADFYLNFSFLEELSKKEHTYYIVDEKVYRLYEEQLAQYINAEPHFLLEAVETNKTIDMALKIIDQMVEMKSKRNTTLISIGGGIVQDVSGFIANILYRGISWVWIPTTLLAQADSCIGSKTSLNYKNYKNILGYFYPPDRILIDTTFVHSLEEKDYLSGIGEMVKCALMAGYDSFCRTRDNIPGLLRREKAVLETEITKALAFKKKVIERDEFDKGFRNIMNYGHTFGHALESTSHYAIPHGQAVSFGILVANQISNLRGWLSEEKTREIAETLYQIVLLDLLKDDYFSEEYLSVLKKDKKFTGTTHTCILFDGNGVKRYQDVTDEEIMEACNRVLRSKGAATVS